eukprot:1791567-Alexandrium_andersonii.AAC.1
MSASLVGSEMCIRDRPSSAKDVGDWDEGSKDLGGYAGSELHSVKGIRGCLLYTSDAADDM